MNNTEHTDEYYFDHLPQPVHQLTEIKDALSKHKIVASPWVNAENAEESLFLNGYKKMYKVRISKIFGHNYDPPGFSFLFDNMFIEFNFEPVEREHRQKQKIHEASTLDVPFERQLYKHDEVKEIKDKWFGKPYSKDEIQEMKTAKFELCEKLNSWGLVDPTTLWPNDRAISLWKPKANVATMTKPEDRRI